MQLKARLLLTLFTVLGALLYGVIGGWFGPLLTWAWLPIIAFLSFLFVLPWSPVTWSQEELKEEMEEFLSATEELNQLRPTIMTMQEELEKKGGLSLKEVQALGEAFEEARRLSDSSTRILRELLFHEHRRMLVVQLLLVFFAALGGVLMTHRFYLWFSQ